MSPHNRLYFKVCKFNCNKRSLGWEFFLSRDAMQPRPTCVYRTWHRRPQQSTAQHGGTAVVMVECTQEMTRPRHTAMLPLEGVGINEG